MAGPRRAGAGVGVVSFGCGHRVGHAHAQVVVIAFAVFVWAGADCVIADPDATPIGATPCF